MHSQPVSARWLASLLAAFPALAWADLEAHPYAGAQYEFNSNIFALASREEMIADTGQSQRSDTDLRSTIGLDAKGAFGPDRLSGTIEGRRYLFDRFSDLDHNEYLYTGEFDWKAASILDGKLGIDQERRMAAFSDRISTQLAMEIDRVLDAGFNVDLDPEWRMETGAKLHRLNSPLPGFPDFKLRENTGTVALKYRGTAKFTSGLQAVYVDGRFSGVPDSPAYSQFTGLLTSTYTVSGKTDLDSDIGYTYFRSRDPGGTNIGGLSVTIGLNERFTGKTSADLHAYRRVEGFVAGADAVTDTGIDVGLQWQATTNFGVQTSYEWVYSEYGALGPGAPSGSDRRDHAQLTTLSLNFLPLDWLALRLYGNYTDRESDVQIDGFNQAIAGIDVKVRMP